MTIERTDLEHGFRPETKSTNIATQERISAARVTTAARTPEEREQDRQRSQDLRDRRKAGYRIWPLALPEAALVKAMVHQGYIDKSDARDRSKVLAALEGFNVRMIKMMTAPAKNLVTRDEGTLTTRTKSEII